MKIQSPLKREIDSADDEMDLLNREYQKYFSGEEKNPPLSRRNRVDRLFKDLKRKVTKSHNRADKFLMESVANKYQLFASRWDKNMLDLERGIPIKFGTV